jgi:hypothetical protein
MAKKSFPETKEDFKTPKANRLVKIRFTGSCTIHSVRYDGIQEWQEGDYRLEAAKGCYEVLGISEVSK